MDAVTSCSLAVGPGTLRGARTASAPDAARSGSRPRNTARQWNASATMPAMAGPISPGTTHAVESIANIRGRSDSGIDRPIAT